MNPVDSTSSRSDTANQTFAAVDLGSNSFHLVVARADNGTLQVVDRIKDMVRLAGGLDHEGILSSDVRDRAITCLSHFGQRLAGMPADNVRVVATQSLRRMRHPAAFLLVAQTALGHPVEVISGEEEARLVYLGVSQAAAQLDGGNRLVMDVGGGSTEVIIGKEHEAVVTESVPLGCVGVTRKFFGNGQITAQAWQEAWTAVALEFQRLAQPFGKLGWVDAVGSSGTLRALAGVCGGSPRRITRERIAAIRKEMIEIGAIEKLNFEAVSSRRSPVFPGGVVIASAAMDVLDIESMSVSSYALREGALFDLQQRLSNHDPRDASVAALQNRFSVDQEQAQRVCQFALTLFDQVAASWKLGSSHRNWLRWAAQLHEVGLSISHSDYENHGAYLVEHVDAAGFSVLDHRIMSTLVGCHRGKLKNSPFDRAPEQHLASVKRLAALLRLAALHCRSRTEAEVVPHASADDHCLTLGYPDGWLDSQSLVQADLARESKYITSCGIELKL